MLCISPSYLHNYMCYYSGEGTQESSQETIESETESDACWLIFSDAVLGSNGIFLY